MKPNMNWLNDGGHQYSRRRPIQKIDSKINSKSHTHPTGTEPASARWPWSYVCHSTTRWSDLIHSRHVTCTSPPHRSHTWSAPYRVHLCMACARAQVVFGTSFSFQIFDMFRSATSASPRMVLVSFREMKKTVTPEWSRLSNSNSSPFRRLSQP